jgi:hypothetical protein
VRRRAVQPVGMVARAADTGVLAIITTDPNGVIHAARPGWAGKP